MNRPPAAPGRSSATGAGISLLIVAVGLGCAGGFVLATPEHRSWPFPWHPDDYVNLGLDAWQLSAHTVRPVSRQVTATLAQLGPGGLFAGLAVLVVLFTTLSVVYVAAALEIALSRTELLSVGFGVGFCFFLFEFSSSFVWYTGHITNAVSSVLGMAAAVLALSAVHLSWRGLLALLVCHALSAFAKEDFLALPLVPIGFAAADRFAAGDRRTAGRAALLFFAVVIIGAAAVAFNVRSGSPFLFGTGTYRATFHVGELATTAMEYLAWTRYTRVVAAAVLAATALSLRLRLAPRSGWLLVYVSAAALIAPYAPLRAHRYALYAYDWLPLMLAAVACTVAGTMRLCRDSRSRYAAVAAIVVAVVVLGAITRHQRRRLARDIASAQQWSRRVVRSLRDTLPSLPQPDQVLVAGVETKPFGPWFASDGRFLDATLGRDIRWLVVLPRGSFARRVIDENRWPYDWGRVAFLDDACREPLARSGRPLLRDDGTGHLAIERSTGAALDARAGVGQPEPSWCSDSPAAAADGSEDEALGGARQALLVVAVEPHVDADLTIDVAADDRAETQTLDVWIDGTRIGARIVPRGGGALVFHASGDMLRYARALVTLGGLRLVDGAMYERPPAIRSVRVGASPPRAVTR